MIELGSILHGQKIATAMKAVYNSSSETVISRSERGRLYGGCIFSDYTGTSVCMHIAGFTPTWINRDMIAVCFRYAFNQLHSKVIIGRVASTNVKALKLDLHLGFREVARIKDAVPDGDIIILELRREDCKWLNLVPKGIIKVFNHGRMVA
jgi:RimJ/RimL family protein N-acetyltransferase